VIPVFSHLATHFWAANSLTKPFLTRLSPLGMVMVTRNQPRSCWSILYVSMPGIWHVTAGLARIRR
jgi:hypothetical protein